MLPDPSIFMRRNPDGSIYIDKDGNGYIDMDPKAEAKLRQVIKETLSPWALIWAAVNTAVIILLIAAFCYGLVYLAEHI